MIYRISLTKIVGQQKLPSSQPRASIGYDGVKEVKGRKRHVLVDTLGLILVVVVTAANGDDRQGLKVLLSCYFAKGVTRLRKIWVDGNYSGSPPSKMGRAVKESAQSASRAGGEKKVTVWKLYSMPQFFKLSIFQATYGYLPHIQKYL